MSERYSIDELMVATLAREFTNETRAFNGAVSFVPVCAYLLARRTHAPDLVWAASSIAIDADPASAQSFWDERIAGPETHAAFLDANGGARTLLSIARRTM